MRLKSSYRPGGNVLSPSTPFFDGLFCMLNTVSFENRNPYSGKICLDDLDAYICSEWRFQGLPMTSPRERTSCISQC